MYNNPKLNDLTTKNLNDWLNTRLKNGQRKYKDSHLKRNGIVDCMEELLDLINILNLHNRDRWNQKNYFFISKGIPHHFALIKENCRNIIDHLKNIELLLNDNELTDEKGGERIWINNPKNYENTKDLF